MTIMNARAITPRSAMENATPADLPIMMVAVAVPGPQKTRAAVPRNSAATFRRNDASALDAIACPHRIEKLFDIAEQKSRAASPRAAAVSIDHRLGWPGPTSGVRRGRSVGRTRRLRQRGSRPANRVGQILLPIGRQQPFGGAHDPHRARDPSP